jgi:hypothetical protein
MKNNQSAPYAYTVFFQALLIMMFL